MSFELTQSSIKASSNSMCTVSTLDEVDLENNIKTIEDKCEKEIERSENVEVDIPDEDPGRCSKHLGLIFTLLSTCSFSLAFTILKKYSRTHPFNFGTWAFPLATCVSLPFIIYRSCVQKKSLVDKFWDSTWDRNQKKTLFFIFARTVLSSHIPYVLVWSLQYISVADMRTILAASVITLYIVGWLFLGEKCGIVPLLVALLAICGIGVMARPPVLTGEKEFDTNTLKGVSLALLALALVTIVIATVRYLKDVPHYVLNFILYVWASIQSLCYAIIFNKLEVPPSITVGLAMSSAGVLMALGNLFLVLALQRELAGVVGLVRTSEVVFTYYFQYLLLGYAPDYISVIGSILVISGVIVVIIRKWIESLPTEDKRRKCLKFLLY